MPARRALPLADLAARLQDHESKDEERHVELMRFVGATEQYIKTSAEERRVMFQGIADLTRLIGATRETVAAENGKSEGKGQMNQLWIGALVLLGAAVLGAVLSVGLTFLPHLVH